MPTGASGWTPDNDMLFALQYVGIRGMTEESIDRTPVGVLPSRNAAGAVAVVAANLARMFPLVVTEMYSDASRRSLFALPDDNAYLNACREYGLLFSAAQRLTFLTLSPAMADLVTEEFRKALASRFTRLANPGLPPLDLADRRFDHYAGVFNAAVHSGSPHGWAWLAYSYLTPLSDGSNMLALTDRVTVSLLSGLGATAQLLREKGVGAATLL